MIKYSVKKKKMFAGNYKYFKFIIKHLVIKIKIR